MLWVCSKEVHTPHMACAARAGKLGQGRDTHVSANLPLGTLPESSAANPTQSCKTSLAKLAVSRRFVRCRVYFVPFGSSKCPVRKKIYGDTRSEHHSSPITLPLLNNLPLRIPRFPFPPSREQRSHIKPRERVRLGIQHDLVQRQQIVRREEQVKILERLRQPSLTRPRTRRGARTLTSSR